MESNDGSDGGGGATTSTLNDNRAGDQTRNELITAATALFADRGVECVSMATIVREAGQRNNSAVIYHFGSKEGLVHAVVEHHTSDSRRRLPVILAELEDEDPLDGHALISAGVGCVAYQLRKGRCGADYVLMLANLLTGENAREHQKAHEKRWGAWRELADAAFPAPSTTVANIRMRFFSVLVVQGLADWERRRRAGRSVPTIEQTSGMLINSSYALFSG